MQGTGKCQFNSPYSRVLPWPALLDLSVKDCCNTVPVVACEDIYIRVTETGF